jgi:hypothetical protein
VEKRVGLLYKLRVHRGQINNVSGKKVFQ